MNERGFSILTNESRKRHLTGGENVAYRQKAYPDTERG